MRLRIKFRPRFRCAVIPQDYRRGIISYMKEIIPDHYKDVGTRNFCFSFELPSPIYTRKYVEFMGDHVDMIISSYPVNFLENIATGILRNRDMHLFGVTFTMESLEVIPTREIMTDKICFRTLSPVVVRDENNRCLYPNEKAFRGALCGSILREARFFGVPDEISSVSYEFSSEKHIHYENAVVENSGRITIEAQRKTLEMAYCAGIGARRSQGFGLLEMI